MKKLTNTTGVWKGLVEVMDEMKHGRINKIVKIALISAAGLLIIIGLSVYLLLHNYINKMNLVSPDKTDREAMDTEAAGVDSINDALAEGDIGSSSADQNRADLRIASGTPAPEEADEGEESGRTYGLSGQDSMAVNAMGSADTENSETETDDIETGGSTPSSLSQDKESTAAAAGDQDKDQTANVKLIEDKDVLNILLIGSDTGSVEESGRPDSMILLTVNQKAKKIITTSFLKDIYLSIPGEGKNRLNAAYSIGGADLLVDTIQQNFKVKIDKYVMADFFTFIDIVDTIGGITMDVEEDELDAINGYIKEVNEIIGDDENSDLLKTGGNILLNGKQALGYSRNRYAARGDFDRTDKQKEVILTIYEKVKNLNFIALNGFLNTILPHITTNFTENEIFARLFMITAYFEYGLEQWSIPMQDTYSGKSIDGKQVLDIDFDANIKELQKRLYSAD